MNKPKYTLTSKAQLLKAQIIKRSKNESLYIHATDQMYHNTRIRNTHSTLAMKNNHITQVQVIDVVDSKCVGLEQDVVLSISNSYKAFSLFYHKNFTKISPYSTVEMQTVHNAFMDGLVRDAGCFHSQTAEKHMEHLMDWAQMSGEHPIIISCIIHYMIIKTKPFNDGNERIARMWQMMLLLQHNDLPLRTPVLNALCAQKQEYYEILAKQDSTNSCTNFIEFMLQVI